MVAVKKNGFVSIAADTLTSFGNTKETAKYVTNSEKIFKYKENYIAMSGWGATQQAVEHFLLNTKQKLLFDSARSIYQSGIALHNALKNDYFLRPDGDDDPFETSRLSILIANSHGIFSLTEHRYVQDFERFYAYGSGNEFALGAMFAVFDDEDKKAEDIARIGINAGAEFDDGSALPMHCYTVKLK